MKLHLHTVPVFLALIALVSAPAAPSGSESLKALLARMDKAAGEFKAMTAQFTYVTHTEVLNEDNTETGTTIMKKVQSGEVQGIVDFVSPDKHTLTFEKRRVKIYYPKIQSLEVYDLDKHGEHVDKFLMVGFGTSGAELARDYDMSVVATETMKDQPELRAIQLRLVPKSGEARQYVKSMDLWIPEQGDPYPVREKILLPSGDYRIVTYAGKKINPPLQPDALQLKLPPGVKTVYPDK
ncbi:MAG: outer membrane lipoprotein carrier protein LolA [Acidobacteriia bacterium]|nr:outer membrane lipoprotein carrier protein LolA [Terriglobia bacterium]